MSQHQKHDFNYYIARFFLNNGRLTLLLFVLLVTIGGFATATLKTTGFPSPTINALTVFTRYSGASSQTVLSDVSVPLENSIKEIKGIAGYSSTSNNETSVLFINIDAKANPDTVKSDVESAIGRTRLPALSDKPIISKPAIGGPDFVFSVVSSSNDKEAIYKTVQEFRTNLENLNQTSEVKIVNPIVPIVKVKPDFAKISQLGLNFNTIQSQLKTFGQSSPVGSDISIDKQSTSINVSLNESSLDDLKNFEIALDNKSNPSVPPSFVKLSDISTIQLEYEYESMGASYVGINVDGKKVTQGGVIINVKAVQNTDQAKYDQDIKDTNSSLSIAQYTNQSDVKESELNRTLVLRNFAVKDDNQAQVDEVVNGLVGGPLEINNSFLAQIGWIFGALQLVFISMFLFVSWRAAVISAFAIPLSLGFTSIYLYFTGGSFNTLVLFSLVLVIGLVVDPTLVVLEAIQRKIDSGQRGKEAVLAGFDDVGIGLFTSTLTNVIVFIPFGIISGFIGQIFIFIPITIVPAIIGSYVIAIVFVSWVGAVLLKRNPKAVDSEEDNLWPIAKGLIQLNKKILNSRRIYRFLIILGTFGLSIGMAGVMFGFGFVKQTDFSNPSDSQGILASYTFKPSVTKVDRDNVKKDLASDLIEYKGVKQVFSYTGPNTLFVQLEKRKDDNRDKSTDIAAQMSDDLLSKYSNSLFTLDISSSGPGGGNSSFPIQVGLYPNEVKDINNQATSVGKIISAVCKTESGFEVNTSCSSDNVVITQVDDGFTGKDNRLLDIVLNRQKTISSGIANVSLFGSAPNPLTSPVLQSILPQTDTVVPVAFSKITDVTVNNIDVPVIIDASSTALTTITTKNELEKAVVQNPITGQPVPLTSVSTIEETSPQGSISRVNGKTILTIRAKVKDAYSDQGSIAAIEKTIFDYYSSNNGEKAKAIGLKEDGIRAAESAAGPDFSQSILELLTSLVLAIIIIYTILVVFFKSFTKPLVVLYTIPLSFIGLLPALAFLAGGQLGFLEIIGIIILIGLVVNVALYLIDSASSYMLIQGYDQKKAIATATGIRFRSVLLTEVTAIAGLAPLAIYSEFYRSIAVVIMFGLLTTGLVSLITTPILFVFFNWLSGQFYRYSVWNKIFFLAPLTIALPLAVLLTFTAPANPIAQNIMIATGSLAALTTLGYLMVSWYRTPGEVRTNAKTVKAPHKVINKK